MVEPRKVVLYIATSVDGYIARKDGSVDWLPPLGDEDYGYSKFLATVDTVVMGRVTYEQLLTFGPYPYEGKNGYVFSSVRRGRDANVEFVNSPPQKFVERLRSEKGSDIWLVGGAELVDSFLSAELIDRFIISVAPVVLGEGIPLFFPDGKERKLRLAESKSFPSGLVQSTYEPAR